jgi:hypothetical protein
VQANRQNISFVTQLPARVNGCSLQGLLNPRQIDPADQYLAARAVSAKSQGPSGRLLHIVDEILRRKTILGGLPISQNHACIQTDLEFFFASRELFWRRNDLGIWRLAIGANASKRERAQNCGSPDESSC